MIDFKAQANENAISIITPVYRDIAGLTDTLESIQASDKPEGMTVEIIVVNDGADQGITELCRQHRVKEIKISPNRGSYFARNRGIETAQGALIGFVDADIIVDKDWIINAVKRGKQYDYIAGRINVIRDKVSNIVANYQQDVDFNTERHMETIHYGPTANLWVRRSVFETLEPFAEALFTGGDMEFGRRAHMNPAVSTCYADDVSVSHPPRNLRELLEKGKRLAYGHNVIGKSVELDAEFTLLASVKRALFSSVSNTTTSLKLFRAFLFAHRSAYKIYYRLKGNETQFSRSVSTSSEQTTIVYADHSQTTSDSLLQIPPD